MFFFSMSTVELALLLFVVVGGATVLGYAVGASMRRTSEGPHEPFAVMQAAMLGFMGLVLAFGLSLAVGRYEGRRAAVVDESNAIGTTYLRAQTLPPPVRARSMDLLRQFTDASIVIAKTVPGGSAQNAAIARSGQIERDLWDQAGQALTLEPTASAPRLYTDSLNSMFDSQSTRVYGLRNRVPTAVLLLEIVGASIALGLLALHLAMLGRGLATVLLAAALVTVALLVTFDLDRPVRGLITVSSAPLSQVRASMSDPPAYPGPSSP